MLAAGRGGESGALSPHWGNILRVFDVLLDTLRANNVPAFLVRKLFEQLFSFVNVQVRWGLGAVYSASVQAATLCETAPSSEPLSGFCPA